MIRVITSLLLALVAVGHCDVALSAPKDERVVVSAGEYSAQVGQKP